MKLLSPRTHGYIDYALVALLVVAPLALDLGPVAAMVSYVIAAIHLVMSLLTDSPLGAVRLIPFPIHGAVEFAEAATLAASPWIFGFFEVTVARNLFLVAGLTLAVLFLATHYATPRKAYDRYGE